MPNPRPIQTEPSSDYSKQLEEWILLWSSIQPNRAVMMKRLGLIGLHILSLRTHGEESIVSFFIFLILNFILSAIREKIA